MTSTLPTTGAMAPAAPPRRKLGARLSGGHLLMIVSGLAAFILIFALLGRGSSSVQVAVAVAPIEADTQVTPAMVKAVSVPSDAPILDSLVRYDSIGKETRYATSRIEAGVPIAKAQLSAARGEGDKPRRQMTIKVDRAYVGNGRISKGDRVDIISISNDGIACRVATGLRVVALDSSSGGSLGSTSGDAALTVSLEKDGDDLRIATTSGKKIQVVQATGSESATDSRCISDVVASTTKPGK